MIPTIKDIINEQDYYRLKEAYMAKKKKKEHFEQAYDKKGRLKEAYMAKKKVKAKKKAKKKTKKRKTKKRK